MLFIDASREFTSAKSQNILDDSHLERIVQVYRERAEIDRYSHLATRAEIAANDDNLNIPRYVDTFEPEPDVDLPAIQREIDRVEAELVEVRARMAGYLKELGLVG